MELTAQTDRWPGATPEPQDDPGHLLPDDLWPRTVAAAELRAAGDTAVRRFGLVNRTITARSHGGVMKGGPRLGVIHSAETPLRAGYAYSIAANWFATKASTSATVMIDPAETVRLLPDNVVAYHCGPRGNGFTVGVEQAGYASLSTAAWTTPAGLQQMQRVADYMRECRDRWGIPLRWATDAEVKRAAVDATFRPGWCFHDTIRRVLGGTTHYDPMPHYPAAQLMALAQGAAPAVPEPVEEKTKTMDAVILSAGGARASVLFWHDLPVELWGKEEKANLIAAGIPEVWVEKGTLDALVAESRASRAA